MPVVNLATTTPKQEVIDVCEKLLEKAKSGELISVAVTGELTGNKFYTNYEISDTLVAVGLLETLKGRIINNAVGDT